MRSRMVLVICRMRGSMALTARGVKPLFTRRRIFTCRGGSMVMMLTPPG